MIPEHRCSPKTLLAVAALTAALAVPSPARSQPTADQQREAARANGSMLSIFDRDGRLVRTIGQRDLYRKPMFAPDESRVAVIIDYRGNADLWVLDIDSGEGTHIASVIADELTRMGSFVWSPDGTQLAYVALRGSYYGIYRKSATGEGEEELLYRHPGTPLLTDWSRDGRYLGFFTWEAPGGTMAVLPLDGTAGARIPIEIMASRSASLTGPFFSPDGRLVAYQSGELGVESIWVRRFDPDGVLPNTRARQVSDGDVWGSHSDWYDVFGGVVWPPDGDQLYYQSADLDVMAVDVTQRADSRTGPPRQLFTAPPMAELSHVSADGQRFLFAVRPPLPLNRIVLFDRTGKELGRVGEPGLYRSAALSPDGSKLVAVREDPQTGRPRIWMYDISTGRGVPLTTPPDEPHDDLVAWTPDGSHVAYPAEPCDTGLYCEVYQRAWNGEGDKELLFRFTEPGAPLESLNFSRDGRFVGFQSGQALFTVALSGTDPLARETVAFPADEFGQQWPTFSPDSRFVAYMSNESGHGADYYVRSFDAATGTPGKEQWRITTHGPAVGGSAWRPDGREILYTRRLNGSRPPEARVEVMAIEVVTSPTFQAGEPRVLFMLPALARGFTARASQSFTYDGEVFVALVAVPAP